MNKLAQHPTAPLPTTSGKQVPAAPVRSVAGASGDETLWTLLQDSLLQHRELPAFSYRGGHTSFAQLDRLSTALAAYLQAQGLVRGDRVVLLLPNVPQLPAAALAVLRAALVLVPLNPRLPGPELLLRLRDSGARAVIAFETAAPALQAALETLPALRTVVLAAWGDELGGLKGPLINHVARRQRRHVPRVELRGAVRWGEALAAGRRAQAARLPLPQAGPDDIAMLQYTGGTTAPSRAAVLLHRQMVAQLHQARHWYRPVLERIPAPEQPVTLCALPMHLPFGFNLVMLFGLHTGGCTLLAPLDEGEVATAADGCDVPGLVRLLERHRVHSVATVSGVLDELALHPSMPRLDWSALQLTVCGGTPVAPVTARRWRQITACPLSQGYGLAETCAAVTATPLDGLPHEGHVGLPLVHTELRIVDGQGHALPPGQPGEVLVRGPQVMAGYWQRPHETPRALGADGFFATGDIGLLDRHGRLRVLDRKGDVIWVQGLQVYPHEVEDVVALAPGVAACAAVGVPAEGGGQQVKVVVVVQPGVAPQALPALEAELHRVCVEHLMGHKRPRLVEFRSRLPRTLAGKVLRRELRSCSPVPPGGPSPADPGALPPSAA